MIVIEILGGIIKLLLSVRPSVRPYIRYIEWYFNSTNVHQEEFFTLGGYHIITFMLCKVRYAQRGTTLQWSKVPLYVCPKNLLSCRSGLVHENRWTALYRYTLWWQNFKPQSIINLCACTSATTAGFRSRRQYVLLTQ